MSRTYKIPAKIARTIKAAYVPKTLPEGRAFLVIGPNVWGKGDTIEEAYTNARSNGAAVAESLLLYDVPANATVDEMGYTTWTWAKGEIKPEPAIELFRFGIKR